MLQLILQPSHVAGSSRPQLVTVLKLLLLQALLTCVAASSRPHIVTILADDLGWNDVGFHGSSQIPTPNIDALAYNGVVLNRHYTLPTCTPSRSAFLTGRYPIRTGMQGFPLMADEPRGLPLSEVLLPQRLKQLGYTTRMIGKWHQGSFRSEYTPTRRGFDSFLGYWNGFIGYTSHTNDEAGYSGLDLRRDMCTTWDHVGRYATDVFTEEAVDVINKHATGDPLYLHIAHLAPHTGNRAQPLEVPDEDLAHKKFYYITSPQRRLYAEMVSQLDKSVGVVVKALGERGMLNNSIVVFMSDNGAQTQGRLFPNFGSNWPLRGMKFTPHEGGVRGVAAVWSPEFEAPGRVSNQLFHLTDWLPTLYSAAGGKVSDLGVLDGVDQWAALVTKEAEHPRSQVLINIDDVQDLEALIDGRWKISRGDYKDGVSDVYVGEHGRGPETPKYNITAIRHSDVNLAVLTSRAETSNDVASHDGIDEAAMLDIRSQAVVSCQTPQPVAANNTPHVQCVDYCLYDVYDDPCELHDVSADNTDVVDTLVGVLKRLRGEAVEQLNTAVDPAANPARHNNTWSSWQDEPGSNQGLCNYASQTTELALHNNASLCLNTYYVLFILSLVIGTSNVN